MNPYTAFAILWGVWHLEASKFWTDLADRLVDLEDGAQTEDDAD